MSVEPPTDGGPAVPGADPARSPACIRLYGHDPAPCVISMGNVENSKFTVGYNHCPNYVLDVEAEPALAWCIEPNYTDPGKMKRMEAYLEYFNRTNDQTTVRRYFMVQLDKATGEPVSTAICGGPGYGASLNVWDGPECPASGRPIVSGLPWGARVDGSLKTHAPGGDVTGPAWKLGGVRKVDGVLSLMVEVGGQTFYLPATAAK